MILYKLKKKGLVGNLKEWLWFLYFRKLIFNVLCNSDYIVFLNGIFEEDNDGEWVGIIGFSFEEEKKRKY